MSSKEATAKEKRSSWERECGAPNLPRSRSSSSSERDSCSRSPSLPRDSKCSRGKLKSDEDSDSNSEKGQDRQKYSSKLRSQHSRSQSSSSSSSHSLSRERDIIAKKTHSSNIGHNILQDNKECESNSKPRYVPLNEKRDNKICAHRRSSSSSEGEEIKKMKDGDHAKKIDEGDEKIRKNDISSKAVDSFKPKSREEHRRRDKSPGRKSYRSRRSLSRSRSRSQDRRRPRKRSPYHSRHRSRSRERYRDRSPQRRRSRSGGRGYRTKDSRRSRSRSYERRHYRRQRSSSRDRYRRRRRSHSSSRSRSHSRMSSRERSIKGKTGPSAKIGALPLSTTAGAMTPQMALQQTMAAMSAKAQALTGIELPKYYNPAAVNPLKYAEQVQKRKLLWQAKDKQKEEQPKSSVWDKLKFAQDQDGKMTAKFRKLMGIKGEESSDVESTSPRDEVLPDAAALQKQEELFRNLDQQYEMARMSTHTHRGVGLGYSSQAIFPPLQKP